MSDAREDQFRALYDLTRPQIIAYALRRTSSREDAADIVAETYEIAWRRLGDVPAGPAGLLWLYVTARYVLANHGRRVFILAHRAGRDRINMCGVMPEIRTRLEAQQRMLLGEIGADHQHGFRGIDVGGGRQRVRAAR